MNKAILVGRLVKDPEVRYSQGEKPVAIARYTLAVNRSFKRENEPDADFLNIVTLGKQGDFVGKYFRKGMMVSISGKIQVRQWDDPNKGRQYFTEILTDEVEFAESKSSYESRSGGGSSYPPDSMYSSPGESYGVGGNSVIDSGYSKPTSPKPQDGFGDGGFSAITESIDEDDLPF